MATRFSINADHWAGWQEEPILHSGWGPSPIYVTDVKPLKSGKGSRLANENPDFRAFMRKVRQFFRQEICETHFRLEVTDE